MHRSPECGESTLNGPPSALDSWGWQVGARCRDHDPTTFFEAEETSWNAKQICEGCTVRVDCLNFALDMGEQFGVWGGLTVLERRQYKWFHISRSADSK